MSIFEHHHDHHDHDHDHDHDHMHHEDPAQKALADALRVCFRILKVIIVIMLILYCFTGLRKVDSNEVAVRLRFGEMVKNSDGSVQIEQPGGPYFAFPYPIDHWLTVNVKSKRTVVLRRQFWWEISEADEGKTTDEIAQGKQGPLNPEKDGSLLTGDANIIHAQWSISFEVADAVKYFENVGGDFEAIHIIRNVGEQALVNAAAQHTADDLLNGKLSRSGPMAYMQKRLDALESGLRITDLAMDRAAMPLPVRQAYQAVVNAEQDKGRVIEEARKERSKILEGTAGEAHSALLDMIDEYEQALATEDTAKVAKLDEQLDTAFQKLNTGADAENLPMGGEVARVVNTAKTYRTQVVEAVKAEARRFEQLLPQYEANPRIVKSRIWNDAREEILSSPNVELFYTRGQLYIETNRRPDIAAEREQRRLQAEDNARRQAR